MPAEDDYEGEFGPLLDVLAIGSIAIMALIVISSSVMIWLNS